MRSVYGLVIKDIYIGVSVHSLFYQAMVYLASFILIYFTDD